MGCVSWKRLWSPCLEPKGTIGVPWALRDAETTVSLERVSKSLQPCLWEDLALWDLGAAWPVVTVLLFSLTENKNLLLKKLFSEIVASRCRPHLRNVNC